SRGRPQNALTNRSTRRLPSHFEVIDDDILIGIDPTADHGRGGRVGRGRCGGVGRTTRPTRTTGARARTRTTWYT
ncbi:hypothetical protein V8E54_003522, partial [Elaphomyces granulatus]